MWLNIRYGPLENVNMIFAGAKSPETELIDASNYAMPEMGMRHVSTIEPVSPVQ